MGKRSTLFIIFRFSQVAASLILIKWHAPIWLVLILLSGLCFGFVQNLNELKQLKPFGGYANWLTLIRGIAMLYLLMNVNNLSPAIFALSGFTISLSDFLDGVLARKLHSVTKLGGFLDEEMDTLYFIVFGYILYANALCGVYVLLPAIVKYAKDLLLTLLPAFFFKPVRMPIAKWIAGISFVLYLAPFIVPAEFSGFFTVLAFIALCGSLLAEMIIRFSGFSKNKALV